MENKIIPIGMKGAKFKRVSYNDVKLLSDPFMKKEVLMVIVLTATGYIEQIDLTQLSKMTHLPNGQSIDSCNYQF